MSTLTTKTIGAFLKENNIVSANNVVKTSALNNIPFISFIDADNKCTNLFFTKNSTVGAGEPVTPELLKTCIVVYTKNAQGEDRVKLSNGTTRVSLADLLE